MKTAMFTWLLFGFTAVWIPASAKQAAASPDSELATRNDRDGTRWRYVWHNDRWWYWTRDERWLYYDGRQWVNYDPQLSRSLATAGYRKAPAFEKPPAAVPRPPHSWPAAGAVSESELLNSFYFEGRPATFEHLPPGSELLSPLRGFNSVLGGESSLGRTSGAGEQGVFPTPGGASSTPTGGGGFGGPKGSSLGAGSAAGGASTPR